MGQTSACGADENGHVTLCAQWFMVNGARAFAVFTLLLASAALSITVLFLFGKSEKRSRQAAIGCYLGACKLPASTPHVVVSFFVCCVVMLQVVRLHCRLVCLGNSRTVSSMVMSLE